MPTPYPALVANVAPNTVAVSGTTFISAMQITRSMSRPFSLTAITIGALGTSPWTSSSLNAGVSSTRRRMMTPATTTTALSRNGIRQPQLWKASSGSIAANGRKIAAARICPA